MLQYVLLYTARAFFVRDVINLKNMKLQYRLSFMFSFERCRVIRPL